MAAKDAGADYLFNILRPNYNQVDGTPVLMFSNRKFWVEPADIKYSQDKAREGENYSICGNRSTFQPGDIIQPVNTNEIPTVTVASAPQEQEFVGVKTVRIGQIINNGSPVYTNIYFDYLIAFNAGGSDFNDITASLNSPVRKIIMYSRPNIIESMIFQDTTPGGIGSNDLWDIALVDYRFNITILHLKKPDRV